MRALEVVNVEPNHFGRPAQELGEGVEALLGQSSLWYSAGAGMPTHG